MKNSTAIKIADLLNANDGLRSIVPGTVVGDDGLGSEAIRLTGWLQAGGVMNTVGEVIEWLTMERSIARSLAKRITEVLPQIRRMEE